MVCTSCQSAHTVGSMCACETEMERRVMLNTLAWGSRRGADVSSRWRRHRVRVRVRPRLSDECWRVSCWQDCGATELAVRGRRDRMRLNPPLWKSKLRGHFALMNLSFFLDRIVMRNTLMFICTALISQMTFFRLITFFYTPWGSCSLSIIWYLCFLIPHFAHTPAEQPLSVRITNKLWQNYFCYPQSLTEVDRRDNVTGKAALLYIQYIFVWSCLSVSLKNIEKKLVSWFYLR